MKILLDTHMIGRKETGNERYWKNLSQSLSKLNNIKVINYYPLIRNGLYRIFFGFNKVIKKYHPDLIHVQNFTPFIKNVPVVNTVHDLCFKYYPDFFSIKTNFAFKYFFKRSLYLSDAIICVSKETKKQLLNFYKLNPNKIFVIYEAADECFKCIENKKNVTDILIKKFNMINQYFLVVGNIELRKLPYEIIRSFEEISNKFPEVELIFVGPNKLGIKQTKNIKVLGYVTDKELNLLYNGATSLIYLSLCEGFGLPIIEAMATKTPVICNNIPVLKEIAGDAALLIKNKKELIKAMSLLLKNENVRKKYSDLGYKRSKFFSWDKAAKETSKIYEWVLQNNRSRNF